MSLEYQHANKIIDVSGNSLWLGDIQSADSRHWLKQNNIKTVITVADGFCLSYDQSIRHYQYKVLDSKHEDLSQYFDNAVSLINTSLKLGSVLVHCGAGVSRSASIVIAYIIHTRVIDFREALQLVKKKRSVICPNLGFQRQLKRYSQQRLTKVGNTRKYSLPNYEKIKPSQRQYRNRSSLNQKPASMPKPKINSIASFNKQSTPSRRRTAMVNNWLYPPTYTSQQGIAMKQENPSSRSYRCHLQKKRFKTQMNNAQLRKMAQFRFGLTNTQKWKVF